MKTSIMLLHSLWILILVSGQQVSGQPEPVRGRIIDKQTRRPLAFVNITYLASGQGTVSNIDGEFSIASSRYIDFLKFSYVGYHPLFIGKEDLRPGETLLIELDRKAYDIEEVTILPGINPAHRIIRLASDNNVSENTSRFALPNCRPASKLMTRSPLISRPVPAVPVYIARRPARDGATCNHFP